MKTEDISMLAEQHLPVRDFVFDSLKEAILTGNLRPGERLMETSIAKNLGVSRTPIREALRRLQQEGLVDITPRKGAVVSNLSAADIRDVLEVRSALEGLAAVLACHSMTDRQLKAIYEAAEKFEQCDESDFRLLAELDQLFHEQIYIAAGNNKLIQVLDNLKSQIYRYRLEYLKIRNLKGDVAEEHNRLLDALSERDADSAKEISMAHIANQAALILENITK